MLLIIGYMAYGINKFLTRLVRARMLLDICFSIAVGQSTSHHAAQVTDSGECVIVRHGPSFIGATTRETRGTPREPRDSANTRSRPMPSLPALPRIGHVTDLAPLNTRHRAQNRRASNFLVEKAPSASGQATRFRLFLFKHQRRMA